MSIDNLISKIHMRKIFLNSKINSIVNSVLCTDALSAFRLCVIFISFYVRASSSLSQSLLFLTSYVYLAMKRFHGPFLRALLHAFPRNFVSLFLRAVRLYVPRYVVSLSL